jgi:SAM-dependent methyltransferase
MEYNPPEKPLFELETVFEVEDYLLTYGDDLTDERTEAEVASLVKSIELDSPQKILDLACGFGRHANRLAALGHTVIGIDYMPGFLKIAQEKAAEMGVKVDYHQGDMRQIRFEGEFDRVILLFTSFGYFEDSENEQVIQGMARALKPGGLLTFDTLNRDAALKYLSGDEVIEKGQDLLINRMSFDSLSGRFHNRRILIREGQRKDKPFSIRLYSPTEIRSLLERAGLFDYKLLGHDGQPLSANNSRRIVVVATKPIK